MDSVMAEKVRHLLYNDTVELVFDPAKHLYTVDGNKVDGTTGALSVIAKPALLYWAVNKTIEHLTRCFQPGESYDEIQLKTFFENAKMAHRKKATEAADIGSLVHDWISDHVKQKNPRLPTNRFARNAVETFIKWEADHHVMFLESERALYSKQYNYAGTLDFIAVVDGKVKIGDYKTSTGIWDEYWFQIASYQQAYLEEFPAREISGGIIVRIGKDGSLEVAERDDYEKNVAAFNAALVLYRRLNELKAEKPYIPRRRAT